MSAPLTTVQASQALGCSRQKVAALCESGRLAGYQLTPGGPWRIRPEAVEDLQALLETEAADRAARRAALAARDAELGRVAREVRAGRIAVPERIASSPRRRRRLRVVEGAS